MLFNNNIDQGRDPLTGREMVQDKNGEWRVKGDGPALGSFLGIPAVTPETARDMVRLGKRAVDGPASFGYGLLQGGLADTTHGAVSALLTQPLSKLSRAIFAMQTRGADSADTVMGWSPEADYNATRHNEHMANIDFWTHKADTMASNLRKKYGRKQLADIIRAEHEGKKPPQLNEFRELMEEAARRAKDVGLAGKDFDKRFDGRYVRMGRWKWTDPDRLQKAMIDARRRAAELAEELKVGREALDKDGELSSDAEIQKLAGLQAEVVNQQKRARDFEKQWKRSQRGVLRPWGSFNTTRATPLEVVDVRAAAKWEGADRKRRITDWDEAVKKGLDLDRPELLLWDSVVHHFHAIEQAEWMKQIAADPRMSKPIREAPKDWVVMQKQELRSSRAYKHLIGRAVSPWMYHFIKLQEGPGGVVERISADLHSGAKMALTTMAPANWALQIFANPMMVATKSNTSLFRAYPAYMKALFDVLNPVGQGKLLRQFGSLRWLDVATDFDREFMHSIKRENPHINTENIGSIVNHMVSKFGEGAWREGLGTAGKLAAHPFNRLLQGVGFVYRRLDAAARIANYRLLRSQGVKHDAAVEQVNRGWDLFHQNKLGDFLRKGVLQVPGTKVKIPLPFLANSFASVPMTFMRNFAQIVGKTPLQMAELGVYVGLWNTAVQSWTGQNDEDVDRILRNVHSQDNDLIHWIRSKTTPLTPDGQQGIDLWGYHPIGAALEPIPGGTSAFWGAAEGVAEKGPLGVFEGATTGTDAFGTTSYQDFIHRALGGSHILMSPWTEYELDRDDEGKPVQYRYEAPGLWGTTGRLKLALETGQLPLALFYTLGNLGNASRAFTLESAGAASAVVQTLSQFDKTDLGSHPSFDLIADGEDIFSVKPRSWEDVLMRRLGVRVKNPNAFARLLERIKRQKGIETTDFGRFSAEDPVNTQAQKVAKLGNAVKEARSGAYLWGMLRHLARAPESQQRANVLAEIKRRWETPESRRRASMALVKIEMGREAQEAMNLLAKFGLLLPTPGVQKVPKPLPSKARDALRGN
jgi:hypothetical protein